MRGNGHRRARAVINLVLSDPSVMAWLRLWTLRDLEDRHVEV
jgi:hypothetical protein